MNIFYEIFFATIGVFNRLFNIWNYFRYIVFGNNWYL